MAWLGLPLDSDIGFANLPNQIHREVTSRGFDFTLMVVGTLPLQELWRSWGGGCLVLFVGSLLPIGPLFPIVQGALAWASPRSSTRCLPPTFMKKAMTTLPQVSRAMPVQERESVCMCMCVSERESVCVCMYATLCQG